MPRRRLINFMPSRLRVARATLLTAAALAVLSLAIFGVVMVAVTSGDASHDYLLAQRGDAYILATAPQAPIDGDISGRWSTSLGASPPDKILVVPFEDLRVMLAGQAPPHVFAQANKTSMEKFGGFDAANHGELVLNVIERGMFGAQNGDAGPFDCDNCSIDPRLTIVWVRGDAWVGTNLSEMTRSQWGVDARGHPTGDAPILWRGIYVEHNFVDLHGVLFGAPYVVGFLTVAAGLWWGIEARLEGRARPAAEPARKVGTDDLLRLVELSERYLDSLWRYQLAAAVAIALGVVALATFLVPALLAAAGRVFLDPFDADVIIVAMPFALGIIAIVVWGIFTARLRQERRRWRTLRHELDGASDRILDA